MSTEETTSTKDDRERCKGENCPNSHCPVCGECDGVEWIPCAECKGTATVECICEGMGGNLHCAYGCDELAEATKNRET